jgi:transcriptional regulator of acetoin/glycerol metabolism
MESLQSYYWPGNVRELRNVIERAMILSSNSTLVVQVPKFELKGKDDSQKLEDFEQKHIESVLERTGWRVAAAAKILGLKRPTLYSKMKRLGIIHPNL